MRKEREEPGLGASFLQSCEWRIKLREPGMDRCPAEMRSFPDPGANEGISQRNITKSKLDQMWSEGGEGGRERGGGGWPGPCPGCSKPAGPCKQHPDLGCF
ncbi:hypothetical protein QQF64_027562 [Cirrhinus molitorella]|uniref:Uncharacterized protein n=1 Tax=Cirrhinus molitorella TaxID=172907 RepID=A0ABR3NDC9_9TELE